MNLTDFEIFFLHIRTVILDIQYILLLFTALLLDSIFVSSTVNKFDNISFPVVSLNTQLFQ